MSATELQKRVAELENELSLRDAKIAALEQAARRKDDELRSHLRGSATGRDLHDSLHLDHHDNVDQ